jgi:hypothetical protein
MLMPIDKVEGPGRSHHDHPPESHILDRAGEESGSTSWSAMPPSLA